MKNDFVMPVLVLALVCLVMSGALAVGNGITRPIIESAAADRSEKAMKDIIPQADAFIRIEGRGFPKTITEAYKTGNDTGYIFKISTLGYDGYIDIICGIGPDGKIIKSITLAHTETKGLGTAVIDREGQYAGKGADLDGISAVSGATITSDAYLRGIRDAFAAYEMVAK